MEISFPGGVAVTADYQGFTIRTDQPIAQGGGGSAPSPFDLFLVSLGTCAGYFALRFCQERGIDSNGLRLNLRSGRDAAHRLSDVVITLTLPANFPEKYRRAILKATDQCAVKRALVDPPHIVVDIA